MCVMDCVACLAMLVWSSTECIEFETTKKKTIKVDYLDSPLGSAEGVEDFVRETLGNWALASSRARESA